MRIAVIGGGATGALAAAHLVRRLGPERAKVSVIDPAPFIGRGLAYSTRDPRHLLNVRIANMSAFADEPDHLLNWLRQRGGKNSATPFCFISRAAYGDYVSDIARQALDCGAIRHIRDLAVDLFEEPTKVTLRLASGLTLKFDRVVLATGHDPKPAIAGIAAEPPWTPGSLDGLDVDAPLMIVGAGLTMVDMALSLDRRGHRGPIVVVSRRGLISHAHRPAAPRNIAADEIPFGADVSRLLRWIRARAAEGADWRAAVDALRPHTQRLWRSMTKEQKRRFLRHARVFWDIHRHRMAPEIEAAVAALRQSGRLSLIAGTVLAADNDENGVRVKIRRRGADAAETRTFARVIDCTGFSDDVTKSVNPLIPALLKRGALRPDELGIGLDIAETYATVDVNGAPSRRIFAIGPLARAAFWECIAIPDIRVQCRDIADGMFDEIERGAMALAG